jgi:hypothetical protein
VAAVFLSLAHLEELVDRAAVQQPQFPTTLELQIPAVAVAVESMVAQRLVLVDQVAPASSSFVTLAYNAAQAARSHLLAATPSTLSLRPALTRHKESTWRTLQK